MRKKSIYLFSIAMLFVLSLNCQIDFSIDDTYREGIWHYSGMANGFTDLNGDYYDDLLVINKSTKLIVGYNQDKGKIKWLPSQDMGNIELYSVIAGDLNNDGRSEIMGGGTYTGSILMKSEANGNFSSQEVLQPFIHHQASNFIDFNNDGYLDYFACHDDGLNVLMQNDGTGKLNLVDIIDFSTIPESDNSGNYGSEWADIDNDGDLDLYIAKCRFGVDNVEDPRRHNMLYINNGNGTFTNEAEQRGLKDKGQSWTGSFADWDNDGDLDCVVTNHDAPHRFYKNDGKGFFSFAFEIPTTFAFQSLWADFDNDGWLDLLITGNDVTFILKNNEGTGFEKVNLERANSAAVGDINDDGFIDINTTYGLSIKSPGFLTDRLYINDKNENHFIKICLKGDKSNRQGIGARITLFGPWGKHVREVHSGVSYGISNSLNQIFGLGKNVKADSIHVRWPSGIFQSFSNINADNTYLIEEGKCLTKRIDLFSSKDFICKNESLTLTPQLTNYISYKWNTGSTEPTLTVSNQGAYQLMAIDQNNCTHFSSLKFIEKFEDNKGIIIPNLDEQYFCDSFSLYASINYKNFKWNNTIPDKDYLVKSSGQYVLTAQNLCNELVTDTINMLKVNTSINIVNDTVPKGGTALIKAIGNNVKWYESANKEKLVHSGNELTLVNVQKTTSYFAQSNHVEDIKKYTLGEKIPLEVEQVYTADNKDLGLYLTFYQDVYIKSFVTKSDLVGKRRVLLISEKGDTIGDKIINIDKANSLLNIDLDFYVKRGVQYLLKTDTSFNKKNIGIESPRLMSRIANTSYPYEIDGVVDVLTSYKGGTGYYYFFEIKIHSLGIQCEGPFYEVKAILDTEVSTEENEASIVSIYPNPTNGFIEINVDKSHKVSLSNALGQTLNTYELQKGINKIDLTSLNIGLYFINFIDQLKSYKVVKY